MGTWRGGKSGDQEETTMQSTLRGVVKEGRKKEHNLPGTRKEGIILFKVTENGY